MCYFSSDAQTNPYEVCNLLNEPEGDFSFRCKLALSKKVYEISTETSKKKSNRNMPLENELRPITSSHISDIYLSMFDVFINLKPPTVWHRSSERSRCSK
jgi:hypothetical protein